MLKYTYLLLIVFLMTACSRQVQQKEHSLEGLWSANAAKDMVQDLPLIQVYATDSLKILTLPNQAKQAYAGNYAFEVQADSSLVLNPKPHEAVLLRLSRDGVSANIEGQSITYRKLSGSKKTIKWEELMHTVWYSSHNNQTIQIRFEPNAFFVWQYDSLRQEFVYCKHQLFNSTLSDVLIVQNYPFDPSNSLIGAQLQGIADTFFEYIPSMSALHNNSIFRQFLYPFDPLHASPMIIQKTGPKQISITFQSMSAPLLFQLDSSISQINKNYLKQYKEDKVQNVVFKQVNIDDKEVYVAGRSLFYSPHIAKFYACPPLASENYQSVQTSCTALGRAYISPRRDLLILKAYSQSKSLYDFMHFIPISSTSSPTAIDWFNINKAGL